MAKRKKPGRRGWPAKVRKRALVLLKENGSPAAVVNVLRVELKGKAPARSTVVSWARAAGLVYATSESENTAAATAARLERLATHRDDLSELLVGRLARPAAELLAARLQESKEAEEMVRLTREAYRDAYKVEAQVKVDFGPRSEEYKESKVARLQAWVEFQLATGERVSIRNLVGVLTRSVADHLTLEGLGEDQPTGDLILELLVPDPDPKTADDAAVRQDELAVRRAARD